MSEWNGVPPKPEQDGWHFLLMNNGTLNPTCWRAKGFWVDPPGCSGSALPEVVALWNSYVAPALMPDQAAALQKRVAELEEALGTLEKAASYTAKLGAVTGAHWLGLGTALIKARAALTGGKDG